MIRRWVGRTVWAIFAAVLWVAAILAVAGLFGQAPA